ncbi:DUF1801 domain-containing protein [uncultured Microbacterium sp.]|uniref:YdhG-like domain-containing protein n=1 Tax=uncultured Microbacterium sp. TaxID=191216 RepID=A0A1Y5P984_9MICO|nr:DUF1801 domain-containing protein [uncultured Microbacterium sp.]SBS72498.1 conserved hypothetical protein [uncultured Microbacterium sp.]
MKKTGGSVGAFVAGVTPAKRRRDAETLIALLSEITGRDPELWGTIIGFGSCHYRYPTGVEGDMPLAAFAPRAAASTIYLDAAAAHADELARLGPHTSSVTCLYIKDLEQVDEAVLRGILESSLAYAVGGGDDDVAITVTG